MSGKARNDDAKANGNRESVTARKRTLYPNHSVSIEDLPEGGRGIVFRMEAPYERVDFPLNDDVSQGLGRELLAAHVEVPDILPPFMQR
jgi:hypothetical protein